MTVFAWQHLTTRYMQLAVLQQTEAEGRTRNVTYQNTAAMKIIASCYR